LTGKLTERCKGSKKVSERLGTKNSEHFLNDFNNLMAEAATGRSSSSLSRTLKTMARYGIVRMEKVRRNIRPVVEATNFTVQFGLYANGCRKNRPVG
jgi:DNA-binding HxlR family transcriptional regulator